MLAMIIVKGALEDLDLINQVIDDAVMSWPLSERNKRLSVPILSYDQQDFTEYRFILGKEAGQVVGAAAWNAQTLLSTPSGNGYLLHGLYIASAYQGRGFGTVMLRNVLLLSQMQGADGLLVKAQRPAVKFFEHCGMVLLPAENPNDYPYQFWAQKGSI